MEFSIFTHQETTTEIMSHHRSIYLRPFLSSFLILCMIFFTLESDAKGRKKTSAQVAVVKVNGAAVYKGKSFDAPVIHYFEAGQKVLCSVDIYKGFGGFGGFYKVRVKKNVYGYMADTDLITKYHGETDSGKRIENPEYEQQKTEAEPKLQEIFFQKFMGLNVGSIDYTERFNGRDQSAQTTFIGVKFSGLGVLFDGPPLDANFNLLLGAPSFYSQTPTLDSTGFMLHGDLQFPMPLYESGSSTFYIGAGLMFMASKYKVSTQGETVDSTELRLGAVFSGGYGYRFLKKYIIKAETKYYYEREQYPGLFLALQVAY